MNGLCPGTDAVCVHPAVFGPGGHQPPAELGDGTVPVLIELDRVVIYLTLEGTPSSLMRLELEPFDGEVDPDLITALAHHPHSRDVTVDGESWELLTLKRGSLPWASMTSPPL